MENVVVTKFVEGDTEVEFYKKLITYVRTQKGGRLQCSISVKNVKGVGKFQSKVCRIFEHNIKAQNPRQLS